MVRKQLTFLFLLHHPLRRESNRLLHQVWNVNFLKEFESKVIRSRDSLMVRLLQSPNEYKHHIEQLSIISCCGDDLNHIQYGWTKCYLDVLRHRGETGGRPLPTHWPEGLP
jgi:hypothetical protein